MPSGKGGRLVMRTGAKFVVLLGVLLALALAVQPATAGVKINIGSTYGPDAPVHQVR